MLEKVTERIFCLEHDETTNRPYLGYVRGDRFSVMLDAGNSPAHVKVYMDAVQESGLTKPSFVGITHWHWDHSFGIVALDIPTIASKLTNSKLREMTAWKWDDASMSSRVASREEIAFSDMNIRNEYKIPGLDSIVVKPADIEFTDSLTIDLGGVHCVCYHVGGPHSEDSTVFYIPEERFLFLGDGSGKDLYGLEWTFDPNHMEEFGAILGSLPFDPEKLRPFVEFLENLEFDTCLLGHVGILEKQALLNDLLPYVK